MENSEHKNNPPQTTVQSPILSSKDPSLSASLPTTSKAKTLDKIRVDKEEKRPCFKRCLTFLYNREEKTFCGRTCQSWFFIITYSFVYLCFLCTYTSICLYCALWCIRLTTDFKTLEKLDFLTYPEHGIGLSATPTSESTQPLIWYRKDHDEDYQKYVNALDNLLLKKRRKRHDEKELGPCGASPYGYGSNPCVIVRINKKFHWSGKPLVENSTEAKKAPLEVQTWLKRDKKLWLHCGGYHSYDKEHVGRIRYYPDPPGFDPKLFPLGRDSESPLVAVQISNFTLGMSLALQCNLWYVNGPSTVDFMLYVASGDNTASNRFNG